MEMLHSPPNPLEFSHVEDCRKKNSVNLLKINGIRK